MVKYLFLLVVIINQLRIMLTQMSFLVEAKPRFFVGAARFRFLNTMPPHILSSSMRGLLFFFVLLRQILFGKVGRFLFLLVGASFLLVALTACAGGGGSGSGSSPGSDPDADIIPEEDRAGFTFAPIPGGFEIGGQSLDLGDFVFLNFTATSSDGMITHRNVSIAEFIAGGYNFTGLDEQSNYTFVIEGILSDNSTRALEIDFVWDENKQDHESGGLRPGLDTDGDRRANSVDPDDDNDGVLDTAEAAGCRLITDCDDDGLGDNDPRERQDNSAGESCSVLEDCDDDEIWDIDEFALQCVIRPDCDRDGIRDIYEEAACVINPDCDGDNVTDGIDIDRDGDGLIEIGTAEELNGIRYALNGNGRQLLDTGMLNTSGCVGDDDNNTCSGYELIADIELAAYIKDTYGTDGWQPLGHDTRSSPGNQCEGDKFDGTFEGNGRTISGLNISRSNKNCVGLFGQLASGATIRNLTLIAEEVKGKDRVGVLVGNGEEARIISSSVEAAKVSGRDDVGGLVGKGNSAQINSSSVVANEVSGSRNNIGGLVGTGQDARIHSSSVVAGEMSGDGNVGGLVGSGSSAEIRSSSVEAAEVSGGDNVGGLVGVGQAAQVHFSSVELGNLSGDSQVGGMLGVGQAAEIHSSSVEAAEVSGGDNVGGLVGFGQSARIHSSSVVAAKVSGLATSNFIGGLVGIGNSVGIINSSVLVGEVKGINTVGGLVGSASRALVYSSSVLVGNLSGNDDVGGLMGTGKGGATRIVGSFALAGGVNGSGMNVGGLIGNAADARIIASFVVAGDIRGNNQVGGMLGTAGNSRIVASFAVARGIEGSLPGGLASIFFDGIVSYSYLVPGRSDAKMLVNDGRAAMGFASYWDRNTRMNSATRGTIGSGKSTSELQMPTDYDDIYATWDGGTGVEVGFDDRVDNITIWCDGDNSGAIEAAERRDDNRIWDFGTENEYPVVRCSSLSPAEVRSWWFLDENDKPQLNQTRLDEKLDDLNEALELNQIRLDEALQVLPSLD